ncbi:MAG: PAS domain S-box protein [Chloroflexi bacterium]|nr:PAS domain S-box protein [Chloroflexota bacterium]
MPEPRQFHTDTGQDAATGEPTSTPVDTPARSPGASEAPDSRSRQMVDNAPLPIFSINQDGCIGSVNPAAQSLFGADVTGQPYFTLLPQAANPHLAELVERVLAGESFNPVKLEYHRSTGQPGALTACLYPVYDADGQAEACVVAVLSLQPQRQPEDDLHASERFVERVLSTSPVFVYVYDFTERRNVYVNRQMGDALGYTPAQLQAMKDRELARFVHPDDGPVVARNRRRIFQLTDNELIDFEFRIVDAAGNWHWMHAREGVFSRSADGRVAQVLGIAVEMTDRKQLEEELRQNLTRYKALFDSSPQVHYLLDLQYRILSCNRLTLEQSRQAGRQEPQVGDSILNWMDSRYHEAFKDAFHRCLQGERIQFESRIVHPDGNGVWYEISYVPVSDDHNQLIGVSLNLLDITRRKEAEESLRTNELRYRALFERTNDAIFIIGLDRKILKVNQRAADMLGFPLPAFEGAAASAFASPAEWDNAEERWQQVLAGQPVPIYERTFIHRDGTPIHTEINLALVRDDEGYPMHVQSVVRDISARKLSEQALRQSEAYFRTVISSTQEGIWIVDNSLKTLYVNQYLADMLGYSPQELTDAPLLNFFDDEGRAEILNCFTGNAAISLRQVDFRLARADHSSLWAMISVTPLLENEQRIGSLVMVTDITQRKQIEAELRRASAYNRGLIEASLDPLMTISPEGFITDVNVATERMTGVKRARLIGTDFSSYFTEPDKARDAYQRAFEEGNVKDYELSVRHPDGRVRFVVFNAAVYRDEEDRIVGVFAAARDITDRRRIEENLRRSMIQNQALLNAIPDMILRLSRDGRYLDIKPAIGFDPLRPPEELLNLKVDEVMPPPLLEPFYESVERTLATGDIQSGEYALVENGQNRTYEFRMVACSDDEVISIVRDVTDRKRVEEGLRDSEKRLRLVLENLPIMLDAFDEDGNIVFWNRECERVTGYSAAEVVGNPRALEWLYPDAEARERMLTEWSRTGNNYHDAEWPITRKDGEVRIVSWTSISGRIQIPNWQTWSIGTDVTKRKWVEEALRESEDRFRTIFESAAVGMAVSSLNGDRMGVNPALQKMLGYSFEELYGMNFRQITHPDDLALELELANELRQGKRTWYQVEKRYLRKDGSYFWARLSGSMIRDPNGEPQYALAIVEDITESKLAAQKELELIHERERVQILANFIQDAAHEFRTPLSIINTSAYLLGRIQEGAVRDAHLEKIAQQVKNITTLVENLLTLSRLDTDGTLDVRSLNLNDIAANVQVALQGAVEEKQQTLRVEPDATLPAIMGDVSKLHTALLNITGNAVRYTPSCGTIVLRTFHTADAVALEVRDNGVGIRPEVIGKVFDRFYREDRAHSTPGFGLGLAIARKIVEHHGGHIEVESVVGEGSIFRVILPKHIP